VREKAIDEFILEFDWSVGVGEVGDFWGVFFKGEFLSGPDVIRFGVC
jgi:hypothetical protein